MHTDNTEPEVSVGLHGTIKESPESESKSKYSRSYEWRAERHDKKISKLGVYDCMIFRVDACINALTVVFLDI